MDSKKEEFEFYSSSNGVTKKQVKSVCRTVEVEPGRFFRKCTKMQQTLKICDGRPTERIEYNEEFNEKDVTDQMVKESFPLKSANPPASSNLTGLLFDREATFRPTEKIGCKKECNEKDVTDQMVKESFPLKSANPPALKSLTGLLFDREATFRPTEKIGCKKECNEKDVTDQMVKDSFRLKCANLDTVEDNQEYNNTHFPGFRSDIEAIERSFFREVFRLYESAKDMTEFINLVKVPRMVEDPPKEDV